MINPAQILAVDNLDDRREIHRLLRRLSPRDKIRFLAWACQRAALCPGAKTFPHPSHETVALARKAEQRPGDETLDARLTLEVYMDLWGLSVQWEFSLDEALTKLVEMGRR